MKVFTESATQFIKNNPEFSVKYIVKVFRGKYSARQITQLKYRHNGKNKTKKSPRR